MKRPAPARVLRPTPRRTSAPSLGASSLRVGTSTCLQRRQAQAAGGGASVCGGREEARAGRRKPAAKWPRRNAAYPGVAADRACGLVIQLYPCKPGEAQRSMQSALPGAEVERFAGQAALGRRHAGALQPACIQAQPLCVLLNVVQTRVFQPAAAH